MVKRSERVLRASTGGTAGTTRKSGLTCSVWTLGGVGGVTGVELGRSGGKSETQSGVENGNWIEVK